MSMQKGRQQAGNPTTKTPHKMPNARKRSSPGVPTTDAHHVSHICTRESHVQIVPGQKRGSFQETRLPPTKYKSSGNTTKMRLLPGRDGERVQKFGLDTLEERCHANQCRCPFRARSRLLPGSAHQPALVSRRVQAGGTLWLHRQGHCLSLINFPPMPTD